MSDFLYKMYERTENWIIRNSRDIENFMWANAALWQIILFMNFLTNKNPIYLLIVIIFSASLWFLKSYRRKKRMSPKLQRIYNVVYVITYGLWTGLTFSLLLEILTR
jgi:hypothetical protein|uniref:DUF202 domain-containing protein n=1 Tax=Pleomorphic virus ThalV2 TaxID=3115753 RepID=A0AAT9JAR0_9VIRU